MIKEIRCSVVMATYNGELYIAEQIDSVLKNMKESDELIISDDGSSDNTRKIVQSYMEDDSRIKLINGPKKGVICNFENALKHAKGNVIFLCDQDDIWAENKIEKVLSEMTESVTLVLHDAVVFQDENEIYSSFMKHRGSKPGLIYNIIKNSYIGCCMAFKREVLNHVMPFPEHICMHDQWIGLINEMCGESKYITDKLLRYRRHDKNASSMTGQSFDKKVKNRINMVIALFQRIRERKK